MSTLKEITHQSISEISNINGQNSKGIIQTGIIPSQKYMDKQEEVSIIQANNTSKI